MALSIVDKCLKESLSENLSQILFAFSGRSSVIHTTSESGGRDMRRRPLINIEIQRVKRESTHQLQLDLSSRMVPPRQRDPNRTYSLMEVAATHAKAFHGKRLSHFQ